MPGLTDREKIFLASSQAFQELISSDPVLDELDRAKVDTEEEYFSVCEFLGCPLVVCGLPVQPVTPALWSFLWTLQNGYAYRSHEIIDWDSDIFLRLLHEGFRSFEGTKSELIGSSRGYCEKKGIDPREARTDLLDLVQRSFRPLSMLPSTMIAKTSEPVAFDADWLISISSIAAVKSNMTIREAAFNLPLSTCYFLWLDKLREADDKNQIRRRTSDELAKEYFQRVEELGKTFCEKHLKKD